MTTPDTTSGDRGSAWLDDHVELFAVGALTPDETTRAEQELAALPPQRRAAYDVQITDIHAAMAGFATTYALDAPPELRDRVLHHVFEGAPLNPDAYMPAGIDPGPPNASGAASDPNPLPLRPARTDPGRPTSCHRRRSNCGPANHPAANTGPVAPHRVRHAPPRSWRRRP